MIMGTKLQKECSMKIWKQENDFSNFPKKKQVLNIFVFNLNGKKMTLHRKLTHPPVEKNKRFLVDFTEMTSLINDGTAIIYVGV